MLRGPPGTTLFPYATHFRSGTYGSVTIGSTGVWTYTLNNADPDTQALTQGQADGEMSKENCGHAYGANAAATFKTHNTSTNARPTANADDNIGDAVTEQRLN